MALPAGFDADALAASVMRRCDRLATFTDEPGRVTRVYLSPAAQEAHAAVRGWMADAGMAVRVDAAGNIVGRRRAADGMVAARTLLLGSHLDTVPGAGKYDGILGVLVGLAAVEALAGVALPFHVDVVGFSEEEGVRFSLPYIGSPAIAGTFDPAVLDRRDAQGVSLRDAIVAFGLDPSALDDAAYTSGQTRATEPQRTQQTEKESGQTQGCGRALGYAEVHLEQGPVLENADAAVGVVTGVQGQSRLILRFVGKAGHAGTVPMHLRQDALVAAAKLVAAVQDSGRSVEGLCATVGSLGVEPNVRNVIPGVAELSLDIRHGSDATRTAAADALLATAERLAADEGVALEVVDRQQQPATPMDAALTEVMARAAGEIEAVKSADGGAVVRLPSGAGHDAVPMAALCPVSMLFVRHPGGVSHHPDERVLPGDVAVAVETMARFILHLAARERHGDSA